MTRQYCHIGSNTIAYLDSAPGDTSLRTYVMLHAFPLGANQWEPQIRSIPAGWRLITPDLRGFGGSTELDSVSALAIADYAHDVVDLLDELSLTRAVIGGLSMGGYAALALCNPERAAFRRGARPCRYACHRRQPKGAPTAAACWRWSIAKAPSGVARDMMPKLLGKTTRETNPAIEAQVRRLIKQQSPVAIRGAIHRMMHRPDTTALCLHQRARRW